MNCVLGWKRIRNKQERFNETFGLRKLQTGLRDHVNLTLNFGIVKDPFPCENVFCFELEKENQ